MVSLWAIPRALPPVTHGSVLQAPERLRRPIRPIRGGKEIQRMGNLPGEGYCCGSMGAYFLLPTAAILFSGGLEGPAWQDWELRHWAAAKTRLEQRPMTEGLRRYAS